MIEKKTVTVRIKQEDDAKDLPLPAYQTAGSSGMDLHCAVEGPIELFPGDTKLISTGISISLPEGYEAQVRPRSGLALKHSIQLLNSPGTIDSDYRGVVGVIVHNAGTKSFTITRGLRIAQMVIQPVVHAVLEKTENLDNTVRSVSGFGHTGF